MKNARRTIVFLAILAIAAGMTGCMLPDFGLSFDVVSIENYTSYSYVNYLVTNNGSKSISNLSLNVDVEILNGTTIVDYDSEWMSVGDLSIGESAYRSVTFTHSSGYTIDEPRITDMVWDE